MMKTKFTSHFFIFFITSLLYGSNSYGESPRFRIEISTMGSATEAPKSYQQLSKKALEDKVWMLEQAVWELQNKVYALQIQQQQQQTTVVKQDSITCMIKTNFDGVFSATESSEMAAKAKVMKECAEKNSNSFECDERHVKCGR